MYSQIAGTGGCLPEKILTNQDLERMMDTSDAWIRERTGIVRRHIAADTQSTVDLAEPAAVTATSGIRFSVGSCLSVRATSNPSHPGKIGRAHV